MTSVGEMLKTARENKGITLRKVEKDIRIREKFISAIESNNWNIFSSKIYIMGIIKNYSLYLGLDPNKMITFFRRDYERKEEVKFKKKVSSKYLSPETRKIAMSGVVILFLLFFAYFGYQLKLYFSPPSATIISSKIIRTKDMAQITGQTDKDASITVSGEHVYPNKDGLFEYDFPLKKGKNEFIAEIVGANGKKTLLKKEIDY